MFRKPKKKPLNYPLLQTSGLQAYNLEGVTEHPVKGMELSEGRPFIIRTALDRLRGFAISPSNLADENNPFVKTMRYVTGGGNCYASSPLAHYYDSCQPRNAAEVLGLDARSKLAAYRPLAAVLPWHTAQPQEHEAFMRAGINGYWNTKQVALTADDGVTEYGPVVALKGEEELKRSREVYQSLADLGYHPDYGYILTSLLIGENADEWALHVRDGIHRAAAMVAMNHSHMPVCITGGDMIAIIRRAEVDSWPHVKSGLFTRDEALLVFDNLLAGR